MAKRKSTKDKQRSIKHTHKTKDRVTHRVNSCASRRVNRFCFLRYNRVVEGLRCVPSSSNQQPENLTKQTFPFPADYPFRSQEKEPIRKRDAKRNNQSTPSKQSLHSIKGRDKKADSHFIRQVT